MSLNPASVDSNLQAKKVPAGTVTFSLPMNFTVVVCVKGIGGNTVPSIKVEVITEFLMSVKLEPTTKLACSSIAGGFKKVLTVSILVGPKLGVLSLNLITPPYCALTPGEMIFE